MWFKNLLVYSIPKDFQVNKELLEEKLPSQIFSPAMSTQQVSIGWAPVRENSTELCFGIGGKHYILNFRKEKKLLPPKVIAEFVKERAKKIEENEGRKPGRKEMRDIKEDVTHELMSKAFAIKDDTNVWLDMENHRIVVNSGSQSSADAIITTLIATLDGLSVSLINTDRSPAAAMTMWLTEDDDPPALFTIDQEAELAAKDESRANVKFSRKSPDAEEVKKHVNQGMQCVKLAMTWDSKVSFVLTEKLEFKRIKPVDLKQEGGATDAAEDVFEADLALMTAEVAAMLNDALPYFGEQAQETQEHQNDQD